MKKLKKYSWEIKNNCFIDPAIYGDAIDTSILNDDVNDEKITKK